MGDIHQKVGAQFSFADHAGDFSPSATANDLRQGAETDVQMQTASVVDNAAVQSAKFDLTVNWARQFAIRAALEFAATPTAKEWVEFWVAWSDDPTAADGNPGGVSGSDGAYTGYSSNLDDSVVQLDRIGTFVVTAQATPTVQIAHCGFFFPKARYGTLVLVNRSGAATHSDDVENNISIQEIMDEAV